MDITLYADKTTISLKQISSKQDLAEDKEYRGYLINSDEKQIRIITETLKARNQKKLIFVQAKDDEFNRRIIETCKINFLVSPELNQGKDTLKQRDSGLNHVSAKFSAKKNISIVINFSELETLDKKIRAKAISRIMQNIKISRKAKCKIKIASFAQTKENLTSENQLKTFLFSLGASSQQVFDSCDF